MVYGGCLNTFLIFSFCLIKSSTGSMKNVKSEAKRRHPYLVTLWSVRIRLKCEIY